MATKSLDALKRLVAVWLRQGVSPQRLALTLALGFAIGCIPILGVTTVLCVGVALALRLNFPVIQAANWSVMPLQVILIVPFVRLGGKLFTFGSTHAVEAGTLLNTSPLTFISQMGGWVCQALLAWLVIAVPAVALITAVLTVVLRRVPALHTLEAAD